MCDAVRWNDLNVKTKQKYNGNDDDNNNNNRRRRKNEAKKYERMMGWWDSGLSAHQIASLQ